MISDEFIKLHGVISVSTIAEATNAPSILIKFNDGRIIKESMLRHMVYDDIVQFAKELILNHSILHQRKLKLNKLNPKKY
jgi:hypothetical protein